MLSDPVYCTAAATYLYFRELREERSLKSTATDDTALKSICDNKTQQRRKWKWCDSISHSGDQHPPKVRLTKPSIFLSSLFLWSLTSLPTWQRTWSERSSFDIQLCQPSFKQKCKQIRHNITGKSSEFMNTTRSVTREILDEEVEDDDFVSTPKAVLLCSCIQDPPFIPFILRGSEEWADVLCNLTVCNYQLLSWTVNEIGENDTSISLTSSSWTCSWTICSEIYVKEAVHPSEDRSSVVNLFPG